MRFQKRTDRPVGADGTAPCDLCGQTVEIDPSGFCTLGHRVTAAEMVAAAVDGELPHAGRVDALASWQPAAAPTTGLPAAPTEEPAMAAATLSDAADSPAPQPVAVPSGPEPSSEGGGFEDLLDFEDLDRRSA